MARVSHHENFPRMALSKGHRVGEPRWPRLPRRCVCPAGARVGTGCLGVSEGRVSAGDNVLLCEGTLFQPLSPPGLSGGRFLHRTPAVTCLCGLPDFGVVCSLLSLPWCGQQWLRSRCGSSRGADARLPRALSRGNRVLELGERGNKWQEEGKKKVGF